MSIDSPLPTAARDRIGEVDIIRGLALFGVLWMNLFGHEDIAIPAAHLQTLWTAPVDRWVGAFTNWVAAGKAQALFSLLFGFGFAMLMDRAEKRGANATAIYIRRLSILLLVGIAHLWLIWMGDILHAYAAMGFLLLMTRRWRSSWLLAVGIPLATLGPVLGGLWYRFTLPPGTPPPFVAVLEAGTARRWEIFQGSDFTAYAAELFQSSWTELYASLFGWVFVGWILGRFLIGSWIYRKGWLQDTAAHAAGFRKWAAILLTVGLLMAAIRPAMSLLGVQPHPDLVHLLRFNGMSAQLVLALGYGAAIVVLCQSDRWRARLAGLGAVGQMALTNYLMQSLVYLFVLYGFGLGLLPYAGATFCLLLALFAFALQIAFSRWWLARYRFGPAEWLWRSGTYGKWQPLRLHPAAEPAPAE